MLGYLKRIKFRLEGTLELKRLMHNGLLVRGIFIINGLKDVFKVSAALRAFDPPSGYLLQYQRKRTEKNKKLF